MREKDTELSHVKILAAWDMSAEDICALSQGTFEKARGADFVILLANEDDTRLKEDFIVAGFKANNVREMPFPRDLIENKSPIEVATVVGEWMDFIQNRRSRDIGKNEYFRPLFQQGVIVADEFKKHAEAVDALGSPPAKFRLK